MKLLPISRHELTDLAALMLEESQDLSVVRPALLATLDLLIEPEDHQALVQAYLGPKVPETVVVQVLALAERGSDYLIACVVDRVLQDMATPQARQDWLAARREQVQGFLQASSVRRELRQSRRAHRKQERQSVR